MFYGDSSKLEGEIMDRILCLSVGMAIASALIAHGNAQAAAGHIKPNIVLILADDMGYGDAGFTGCTDIPTPAIDSIAVNGIEFTQGYVTAPQCAPSRGGLLSGRYQSEFTRGENKPYDILGIPEDVKLFPEYMRDAGYRTGMIGKWHLGHKPGCHPLDRGFDYLFGFLEGASRFFPPDHDHFIPSVGKWDLKYFDRLREQQNILLENREPFPEQDYLTFTFGQKAVDFINDSGESGRPFFLYLSFNAPHTPMQAPEEYIARFSHIRSPKRRVYAAMMAAMDEEIGNVLNALRKNGMEENTLVIFLSDNGGPEPLNEQCQHPHLNGSDNGSLRGVKGDLLEGGIHVPFAMQWKGVLPAGKTFNEPVISLDLLPTALAAANAPIPRKQGLDGANLLPALLEDKNPEPRVLKWRFPHPDKTNPMWAVRRGNWKLIKEGIRNPNRSFSGKYRTALYRLDQDVAEENDLSNEYPEVRSELEEIYQSWNRTLPDPLPIASHGPIDWETLNEEIKRRSSSKP
jgi:arylsulfatase A-like enzyme